MQTLGLIADQKMLIDNVEFRLDQRMRDGIWQIENVLTGVYSQRPEDELLELYRCDKLWLLATHDDDCPLTEDLGRTLPADLDSYSPSQVEIATRYAKYLRGVDEALRTGEIESLSHSELARIIHEVAEGINDPDPPSSLTVRRRHPKWIACARDVRSQLPHFEARGHRNRFPQAMEWLFDCAFRATYLTARKKKITKTHQDLITKLNAINSQDADRIAKRFTDKELKCPELLQLCELRKQSGPLGVPEISVLYRRRNKMAGFDVMLAQMGKRYADSEFRNTFPTPKAMKPLDEVQGDETITDLFCIDEMRRLPLGRAHAVTLFDTFIHGCYGQYIGYEPQSVLSYMHAIRHGILPKTYVAEVYPEIQNKWGIYGKARLYNLDNSMAAHAEDFAHIGFKLNTTIICDLPGAPWFKPMVERFFRELNEQLLHQQIGTTFSRFAEFAGGDYDPAKNAIIPHSLLLLAFHKFVIDVHLQSPNKSINDTPAGRWEAYVDAVPRPLGPRASELDIILGHRFEPKIHHYGIEHDHLFYQSRELGELRKRLSRPKVRFPLIEAMSSPGDLGQIHVLDPDTGKYLRVPVAGQDYDTGLSAWEYANGLSLWAHRVNVRYCRKHLHGRTDISALAEAQAQIWDWVLSVAKLNKDIARYIEDHTRPNPTGPLVSHEMVSKMVEKLAGKRGELAPAEATVPHRIPDSFADASDEQLPKFEASRDLPALCSELAHNEFTQPQRMHNLPNSNMK
jgi:putative transposase